MATPLHNYPEERTASAEYTSAATRWLRLSQERSLAHLRGPLVEAARRLGLASERAHELQEHLDLARDRLLNAPSHTDAGAFARLESRVLELEEQLHRVRGDLWRDLLPLAREARDAAIELNRSSWLNELSDVLGGDCRGPQ